VKIPSRLRRVKFQAAAYHTTSFAGLRFVFDLAVKLGVVQDLRTLTVKKRRRGIPIEDFVMGLASNFLVGGDSLTDLEVLREETVTRELCYGLEVPAPTTAGERLRTFTRGHRYQIEGINRREKYASSPPPASPAVDTHLIFAAERPARPLSTLHPTRFVGPIPAPLRATPDTSLGGRKSAFIEEVRALRDRMIREGWGAPRRPGTLDVCPGHGWSIRTEARRATTAGPP